MKRLTRILIGAYLVMLMVPAPTSHAQTRRRPRSRDRTARQARARRRPASNTQRFQYQSGASRAEYEAARKQIEAQRKQEPPAGPPLEVIALDSQDQPVPGVWFGTRVLYNTTVLAQSPFLGAKGVRLRYLTMQHGEIIDKGSASRNYGGKSTKLSFPDGQDRAALYVFHRERALCALQEISPSDSQAPLTVSMARACQITGRVTSERLQQMTQFLPWIEIDVYWKTHQPITYRYPMQKPRPSDPPKLTAGVEDHVFELLLPPGTYRMEIRAGEEVDMYERTLHIKEGQTQLDLGSVDMQTTPFMSLPGQDAPALGPALTWISGKPTQLSDLKGQPIVLNLTEQMQNTARGGAGGSSATPSRSIRSSRGGVTMGAMSGGGSSGGWVASDQRQLRRILEDFKHEDIALIALCNQDNDTDPDHTKWPFRVAVDMGQRADMSLQPHTASAYHVTRSPATVIIDREGRIARTLTRAPCVEDIELALNTRANWRATFERLYSLRPGEVLKRVGPPFSAVRKKYWFSHPYGVAASGLPAKAVFAWSNGQTVPESGWRGPDNVVSHLLGGMEIDHARPVKFLLRHQFQPGDWIYRPDAPVSERLELLRRILPGHMKTRVALKINSAASRTIRVSGQLHLFDALDSSGVVVVGTEPRTQIGDLPIQEDTIDAFFVALSRYIDQPIVLERLEEQIPRLRYCLAPSLKTLRSIQDPLEKRAQVTQVLERISQQTCLDIRYQHASEDRLAFRAPDWENQFLPPWQRN